MRLSGIVLVGVLFLGGCAALGGRSTAVPALPDVELPAGWEARRSALQAWYGFDLRGRLAVARGEEGFSGNLRWLQEPVVTRLEVDARLHGGAGRVGLLFGSHLGLGFVF